MWGALSPVTSSSRDAPHLCFPGPGNLLTSFHVQGPSEVKAAYFLFILLLVVLLFWRSPLQCSDFPPSSLHSGINPRQLRGPYGALGTKYGWAVSKASILSTVLSLFKGSVMCHRVTVAGEEGTTHCFANQVSESGQRSTGDRAQGPWARIPHRVPEELPGHSGVLSCLQCSPDLPGPPKA